MAYQLTAGKFSATTDAGAPASGFKLYTYASGTTTPAELIEWLAARGLVSDLVVEPRDAATCDLVDAAERIP